MAPAGSASVGPKSASVPQLEFSTERLDLGDGKPNEILRGELTLFNRGAEKAKFSLIKHCGCTELSPLSGDLAPGASETIHVGLQLANHANSEKNTSIEIKAGEPPTIVRSCIVAARCPAPFLVEPAFINLGSLGPDEIADAWAEIRIRPVDGRRPFDIEAAAINQNDAAFTVERVMMPTCNSVAALEVMFRLKLASGLRPGDYWGTLEVRLRDSEYSVRVPLSVTISEPISVIPRSFSLRPERNGAKFGPAYLLVLDHRGSGTLGEVSLVDGPPGLGIEDLGDTAHGRRRLRLLPGPKADAWPAESRVVLAVEGISFEVTIRKPLLDRQ